jgi:hypothetical protein
VLSPKDREGQCVELDALSGSFCGFRIILHSLSQRRILPKYPVAELTRQRSEVQLFPRPPGKMSPGSPSVSLVVSSLSARLPDEPVEPGASGLRGTASPSQLKAMMQGEETPTWLATVLPTPLDVNWQQEGDEWLHHMWAALSEEVSLTGHSMGKQEASPEFPFAHLELVPTSTELQSRLRLVPLQRGLVAVVAGADGPDIEATQVEPWATAIEEATRRVGQRHQSFDWVAVVGRLPGREFYRIALASEARIGSLRLSPAQHYLTEYLSGSHPSLFARTSYWSWPIIVEGSSTGYNWLVAAVAATRTVHRLAALLSLSWGSCWVIREVPAERGEGPRLETPERPWWQKQPETPEEDQAESFQREDIAEWLDEAWSILDADPAVEDALLVYHQGLVLQQEDRESFAMIAFVASIEAIGAKLSKRKRCSCCPECKVMIGSAKQFQEALALVVPEEERCKALAKVVYDQRSTTAHAGRLHGSEAAPGTFVSAGSFFARNSVWEFTSHLWETRKANRDLLLRVLRDRLELSAAGAG